MSEPVAEQQETEQQGTEGATPEGDQLGDAGKAALQAERDARKAAEKQARDFQKQLDTFKQASMSEAEKAVAEAETRGRTAAVTELGRELAFERFDALAGRRNPSVDTATVLKYIDLGKFLGEDGRPDQKLIEAAVKDLVPEAAGDQGPVSTFDGGPRTTATKPASFGDKLRQDLAARGR